MLALGFNANSAVAGPRSAGIALPVGVFANPSQCGLRKAF